MLNEMHFLRPYCLFAFIPLLLGIWYLLRQHRISRQWESVCDPALLPYILVGKSGITHNRSVALIAIAGLFTIIALAGPTWERLPQPVFQKESALVIALDLSYSMFADDIRPSRLERAKFEITDLLDLRKEGQTALLVYAGDAFIVTPLTDDTKTIKSQLSALSPFIMPAPGSHTGIALEKATELLRQAGMRQGHILLVTDEINAQYSDVIKTSQAEGYPVSILAIGTEAGSPIKLPDGSFFKDQNGSIVVPKLDLSSLSNLAATGGGRFELSRIQDSDTQRLNKLFTTGFDSDEESETDFQTDQWREFGPWLVLLVLPLAALMFRRGFLVIIVSVMVLNHDEAVAFDWDSLWLNENQRAQRALQNDKAEQAAELFQDNNWKAAASYKAGDYAKTEQLLKDSTDVTDIYNRANALARQGQYQQAIDEYDRVLEQQADHEDAKYNRDLVKKELEKQQQQQSESNEDEQSEQQDEQQSDSDQQSEQQQSDSGKQSDEQDSQQQDAQQSQQQESQSQQAQQENQEGKEQEQEQKQLDQQQEDASEESEPEQQQEKASKQMGQTRNEIDEQQQSTEQWLRRIPDDPSGLLKRKFKYQYQQQKRERPAPDEQNW